MEFIAFSNQVRVKLGIVSTPDDPCNLRLSLRDPDGTEVTAILGIEEHEHLLLYHAAQIVLLVRLWARTGRRPADLDAYAWDAGDIEAGPLTSEEFERILKELRRDDLEPA